MQSEIAAYIDKFGSGPPIFGLDADESSRRIRQAISSGQPIDRPDQLEDVDTTDH